jgi:uncharacterized protein YfbU (UPF0304 family)
MRLLTLLLLLTFNIYSQDITIVKDGVTITMSREIDSLIKLKCNKIKDVKYMIPGWRVQLDFSNDLEKVKEIRKKFITYHPEIETYIYFDAPNWILRVGNFADKNDAEKLIKDIRPHYKSIVLLKTPIFEPKDEYVREESYK